MTNNKQKQTTGQILAALSAGKKSGWSQDAEYRAKNRPWLRRSQRIALHVLDALDAKSMSQKDLAEAIAVSPQYVSRMLKGGENLSLETISKLEEALGITLLEVRDHAQAVSIKPQMAKTIQRTNAGAVIYLGRQPYNNSRAHSMPHMQQRGSFCATIAKC